MTFDRVLRELLREGGFGGGDKTRDGSVRLEFEVEGGMTGEEESKKDKVFDLEGSDLSLDTVEGFG